MIINDVKFELIEHYKEDPSSYQHQIWGGSCDYKGNETILKDVIEHLSSNKKVLGLERVDFKIESAIGKFVLGLDITILMKVTD